MARSLVLVLAFGLAAFNAPAQSAGGGITGATGGAPTGGTTGPPPGGTPGGGAPGGTTGSRFPTSPTTPTTTTPTTNTTPQIERPVFLSGKVMMDDGSPVPPNVTIQRVCSGVSHAVAYTDSKGRFSFQWGQNNGVFMDASESTFGGGRTTSGSNPFGGGSGTTDSFGNLSMNCELQANLAGFRSDVVTLYNRNSFDNPDVGAIVLHRMAGVEGSSISATSFLAPKDAKKAYERGLQSLLKNKPEDAGKDFEKAVAAYPKYADAWLALGKIRARQKSAEGAREAFLKANEADPKLVAPYVELGLMSATESNWPEAGKYLDRAVHLDPIDYPQAWYLSAIANYNLKNFDQAEKSAREAMKLDPRHTNPRSEYLLGLVLVEKKDYPGAETEFKAYLERAPNAFDAPTVKDQLGRLQKFMADNAQPR